MRALPDIDPIVEIDETLDPYRAVIGGAFTGYRNHVQRMAHVCFALEELDREERSKVVVAACFHDIGLWTAGTFDYIDPSVVAALRHLEADGSVAWSPDVEAMITEHHRLRPVRGHRLAELFRRGDLVDFSLGVVRFGIPRDYIRRLGARYPNAGFHLGLLRRAAPWIVRHPLRPVPMARW